MTKMAGVHAGKDMIYQMHGFLFPDSGGGGGGNEFAATASVDLCCGADYLLLKVASSTIIILDKVAQENLNLYSNKIEAQIGAGQMGSYANWVGRILAVS